MFAMFQWVRLADRLDRRLGGADQLADLSVGPVRVEFNQPVGIDGSGRSWRLDSGRCCKRGRRRFSSP